MLKNYIKIAWRNLLKHKGDAAINIVGLCVAFTAALLIFLSVFFEFSFDDFHKNKDRIYHTLLSISQKDNPVRSTASPIPFLPTLKEEFPEVEKYARYQLQTGHVRYGDKKLGLNLRLTDPDFFSMFSFPFVSGNAETALSKQSNLVLTETSAKSLFGNETAVGKTVEMQVEGEWRPFEVVAVTEDVPDNSSLRYDMVARFENAGYYRQAQNDWSNWNNGGYVQLKKGVSPQQLTAKLAPLFNNHFTTDIEMLKQGGSKPFADGSYIQMGLLPLTELHTTSDLQVDGNGIPKGYLYLLLAIGTLILLIACINFINLSIGRSFTRSHEIGLRKTLGAKRGQVVIQLWTEAVILCILAIVVSTALTYALLPSYKQLFGLGINKQILLQPSTWIYIVAGFLFVTMVAGGYPAWLIARVNIISIFKGKFSIRRSQGLRNSLIVVQFIIAVLLMICTFVTWQQVNYLRNKPLGYNRSQVISIPIEGEEDPNKVLDRFRQQVSGYPNVESVTGIYNNLGRGTDGSSRSSVISFGYKEKTIKTNWMGVSYGFVNTLDLKLVAGRDFNRELASDSNALVINEAMARQLGEKDVIGLQLPVHDSPTPMTVIGVVKDFNFESLHKKIMPVSFTIEKDFGVHYALVKVAAQNLPGSMETLKKVWKEAAPGTEFRGSFLDENIDRQYKKEEKMGQIFISGAIIAIVLSCMGLLAMVLLVVTQRVKEIGIRKVLGANVSGIVLLISKDFLWLVGIAFVVAAPLAWWGMSKWLQQYAYRIDLQWWYFALAAFLAFAIAFITISAQALRAALANPVKSLKTE